MPQRTGGLVVSGQEEEECDDGELGGGEAPEEGGLARPGPAHRSPPTTATFPEPMGINYVRRWRLDPATWHATSILQAEYGPQGR